MELIKITETNGKQVVSAKELHNFLEVTTPFTMWSKRMFEYGFEEGVDFMTILLESTGGRPSIDYAIGIDCAKEISMLQRSEKGKEARRYFIECEKVVKSVVQLSPAEILLRQAQHLVDQERAMKEVKSEIQEVKNEVKVIKAQNTSYSVDYFTIAGFASMHKIRIDLPEAKRLGSKAKSMCNSLGFMVGSIPDPRFGKANTYPLEVLQTTFTDLGYKLN